MASTTNVYLFISNPLFFQPRRSIDLTSYLPPLLFVLRIIQLASYNHWKLKQTETELAAARTESEKNKAHFAQFPIIEERYKSTERTKEAAYKEALRESELSTAALNTFLIELAGNRVEVNKQRERDIVRIQHDILQTAKVEWQSEVRKTVDDELGSKGIESVLKELKEQVKSLKVTEAAHQDLKEEFLRYKKDNDVSLESCLNFTRVANSLKAKLKNLYTTHDTRVDAVRKRMEGLENKVETSNNAEKKYEAVQLDIEKAASSSSAPKSHGLN